MNYLKVFTQPIAYQADVTEVFSQLCKQNSNCLLLESAEISSKNSLKSLLFVDVALKITCRQNQVNFHYFSENGQVLLDKIAQKLQSKASLNFIKNTEETYLTANFSEFSHDLDEDEKLKQPCIFDGLRVINDLFSDQAEPVFIGGLFSYDLVRQFIPLNSAKLDDSPASCDDFVFYLAQNLIIFDHQNCSAELKTFCFNPKLEQNLQLTATDFCQKREKVDQTVTPNHPIDNKVEVSLDDTSFMQNVEALKRHIHAGDVFQIVPSRQFSIACPQPLLSYKQLKKNNPSPYMFYMQDQDFILFGASPESAIKFNHQDHLLEIYPIAGSRPRGFDSNGNIDPELDSRLELELRLDQKELVEHLMLVDLARNDIARVCESGSRQIKELMQIDRYSHIMHLVSRVVGNLRGDLDALHAYQACMNMGTLTGAPKTKAMQLLYQYEQQKRHSYGGAVGYFTSHGSLDTCIVIRSAMVKHEKAYVQAGCGVVLDSNPQMEADETRHKSKAVIQAITQINSYFNANFNN